MASKVVQGVLLDVDYVDNGKSSQIRLFVKTEKGIKVFFDRAFHPYFYAGVSGKGAAEEIEAQKFSEGAVALKVKPAIGETVKVEFARVAELTIARKEIKELESVNEIFEYDIPFSKRYLLDKQLEPLNGIELSVDGDEIKKVKAFNEPSPNLNYAAFDIETLSPGRFSNPEKDPVLMISLFNKGKGLLLTTNKKLKGSRGIEVFASEQEMIQAFTGFLEKENVDVLVTYNGDNFDLPYLKDRADTLGFKLQFYPVNEGPSIRNVGRDNTARLHGIQHLDAYQMLRFLNRFGVVNLVKFNLESVALTLFGDDKSKITAEEINEIWKSGKGLKDLAKYCIEDSETALKIAERYAPLMAEISKLVKQTLFETGRSSASMLVEYLLMNKAFVEKRIAPNKPGDEETSQRIMQTFKGGYVKEPAPGLHERLAVLDFSSLHPSIMISHNVSPETLDCGHVECKKNTAPNNHCFCTKQEGFITGILKELFETRMESKKQLKALKKNGKQDLLLDARQHALKILMNSFYGYLGYARSRWFSRECASAVTAWSRHYVKEVLEKAEKQGFKALYADTDSAFLILPKEKKEKDVEEFVEKINESLPGVMNLELEGFFKRGIFVTKESGEGAKKKYALIGYDNKLKIVGFEYVRRDWSGIAKETQRQVITAILEEGRPEKAAQIIKKTVERLRSGKAKKSELVVLTQLKRPIEKYVAIGPHVAAAKKAVEQGKEMEVGSTIAYVITRSGKSISDRAQLEEYVKEGNYDSEYYIENQVMPAVIKIMRELGYSKQDLLHGGKQSKLGSFFG